MIRKQLTFLLLLCTVAHIEPATDAAPKSSPSWGSCVNKGFQGIAAVAGVVTAYNVYRHLDESMYKKMAQGILLHHEFQERVIIQRENGRIVNLFLTPTGEDHPQARDQIEKAITLLNIIAVTRNNRYALRRHPWNTSKGSIIYREADRNGNVTEGEPREFKWPWLRSYLPGI